MAFVLTTQIAPQSTGPTVSIPTINVVSTNTTPIIVDILNYATNTSLKWLITIIDNTNNQARFLEVSAIHRSGLSIMHNIFGDVGDRINVSIDVILDSPNIKLKLTNNSGADIHISTVRVNTGI